jgi:hypothetical protein
MDNCCLFRGYLYGGVLVSAASLNYIQGTLLNSLFLRPDLVPVDSMLAVVIRFSIPFYIVISWPTSRHRVDTFPISIDHAGIRPQVASHLIQAEFQEIRSNM